MFLAVALLAVAAVGRAWPSSSDFAHSVVTRRVDLTGGSVRVTTNATLTSSAGKSKYAYALRPEDAELLAFIGARDEDGNSLPVTRANGLDEERGSNVLYQVRLLKAPPASGTSIKVTTVFHSALEPLPKRISQEDPQLVVYQGEGGFLSPYNSESVTTKVVLSTGNVESFTEVDGVSSAELGKKTLRYKWGSVSAGSEHRIRVHFESLAQIASFAESEREVTVSHWAGKVAVEEHFELQNEGPQLAHGFARVEYQAPLRREGNSFRFLTASLPLGASNIFYRDTIGNISTSHVRTDLSRDRTVLEILPRFPLFGGWKTVWYQGYDLSTDHCLSVDAANGDFVLRLPASIPYPRFVTHKLKLRLVLPELADNIRLDFEGEFNSAVHTISNSTRFTYLDAPTAGRPVVVVEAEHVTPLHKGDLVLRYSLPPMALWREPAMVTGGIFVAFLSYILLSRVDLSF